MGQVTIQCSADSYTASDAADTNYGTQVLMHAGKAENTMYAFALFNITGIDVSTVTSAYLRLQESIVNTPNMRAYRLSGTFNESTITWNNSPAIDSSKYVDYTSINNSYAVIDINVTTLLQSETTSNFGVRLQTRDTATYSGCGYRTKDSSGWTKPQLIINYEDPVPAPTDHWYVRPGGAGVMNGYDWANALPTVDAGMKAVAPGKTLHIGFGSYTNEPADNVQSPTNPNVTVVFETIGSTGGTGTATVELN